MTRAARSAAEEIVLSALRVPTATEAATAAVIVGALLDNPDVLLALADGGGRELSGREAEIAGLVAEGLANKEIAALLGISPFTVSSFLRRAFVKLGVRTRAQMVAVVLARELLSRKP